MSKPNKGAVFLSAMAASSAPAPAPVQSVANDATPTPANPSPQRGARAGLKHIGGYFERDDVEKFAILRARLNLDNSELIKLAIEDLYNKVQAKKAFGDQT